MMSSGSAYCHDEIAERSCLVHELSDKPELEGGHQIMMAAFELRASQLVYHQAIKALCRSARQSINENEKSKRLWDLKETAS